MATGVRTGGEPSGVHRDRRAEARDTAGGPGRYTNTGHGEIDMQYMNNVVAVLTAVVDAAAFSSVDKQKWVALVQSRPSSNDVDDELSAPVVVACKSHSSNIADVLSDSLDKAQTELDDTRHAESNAAHNFSMLQQALEDQLALELVALVLYVDFAQRLLDKAQTLLDVTCHVESNAVHNFALLKHSLEDHLTQDNKALTKAKADNSEFASSLEA